MIWAPRGAEDAEKLFQRQSEKQTTGGLVAYATASRAEVAVAVGAYQGRARSAQGSSTARGAIAVLRAARRGNEERVEGSAAGDQRVARGDFWGDKASTNPLRYKGGSGSDATIKG